MSEDDASGVDDWFEKALRDDEDEEEDGTDAVGEDGSTDAEQGVDSDSFEEFDDGTEFDTGESDPFGDTDDEDPLGESGADPFGGGDSAGNLFEDDFGSAFEAAGDGEFDQDGPDTDIPRIRLGIQGLDDMIQGGVPERHLITAIGAPGAGKTTFGLQFLYHGLQREEHGVFITLEQSRETIIDTANQRGWEFDRYEDEDKLAVVDLDPVEMANSLDNIRGELPQLIGDFDADRLVLDSVSLLEMMYDDQARRRTEVFDFTRSLKDSGVTTFLTSEASDSNPYASRHGIIEYLTDAVFILQYVRSDGGETRLAVEIQKIRNANHSREKKPYEITMDGISVYQQANIF